MAEKVDQIPPTAVPPGQMPVTSRKVFMRSGEEPPIFINSAEFAGMGMDVFMDVGVVPVESVTAAAKIYQENPAKPGLIDFHVSYRFGMSIQAAMMIHQRLSQFIQSAAAQMQTMAEQVKPPEEKS